MEVDNTNQEILRRYCYLYENKELILSLCIKYDIEEKHYKECLKSIRESQAKFRKDGFKSQELKDIFTGIENRYKEYLKNPRPYLMDKIPDDVLALFENFLFGNLPLEESTLYQEVELIKSDELELAHAEFLIEELSTRRKSNEHLKNRNPFTVWRILNYVRKNNLYNRDIQDYLNIYYNLDRYATSGLNWQSGYYLMESDYEKNQEYINSYPRLDITSAVRTRYDESAMMVIYKKNEFECEDSYFEHFDFPIAIYDPLLGAKTNFVYEAIWGDPIPEESKKKLYQELNGNSKKYLY